MFSNILTAQGGLTAEEILLDIPHDAAAIVVYVLLTLFIGFVWYGSRRSVVDRHRGPSADPGSVPKSIGDEGRAAK